MPVLLSSTVASARPLIGLDWNASLLASDNPFLLPGDDRSAFAADIAARPQIEWLLSPRTQAEASATIGFRQYFSDYGNFLTGRGRASVEHRASDFLSASGFIAYSRELPTDGLASSIDAAIDTRNVREILAAETSAEWAPDARTRVTGNIRAERTAVPGSDILSTTTLHGARIGASRRVNELLSLGAEAEATSADVGPGDRASTQALRFTLNRRLSSAWRADAQIGLERAVPGGLVGADDDNVRLNGRVQICREPPNSSLCALAALRSGVSGLAGIQRETYFETNYRRQLNARTNVTARAEYLHARLEPLDLRTEWTRFTAAFERRLSEGAWLVSSISHLRRKPPLGASVSGTFFQIGISFRRAPQ